MELARIESALAEHGLRSRGGFRVTAADRVPPLGDGRAARTLVLAGNVGAEMWRTFARAPEAADGRPHALDRWSERVLGAVAAGLGAHALFPFGGPPYLPFIAWAKRAGPVVESPLGVLIHPDYGLWHAYRGALAFAEAIALPPPDTRPAPCLSCAGRPCLSACPVGAFTPAGYDVGACTGHIEAPAGAECMARACLARRACPVGTEYRYETGQAAYHMRHFLGAQRAGRE